MPNGLCARIGRTHQDGGSRERTGHVTPRKIAASIEKSFVLGALRRNSWNVTRSAEETGMQRANFQALMRKHGVRLKGTEADPDESADA